LNTASGWYETFFRGYDAALARFVQVDPQAAQTHSMSPYQYGNNNPVLLNDPLGLFETTGEFLNKINELWNSVPDSGGKASWSDDGGDNGETSWTVFVPDPGDGGGGLNVTYTRNGDGTITSNVSAAGSSGILYSTTILDDVEVEGAQQSGKEQFAEFLHFFFQKELTQLCATDNIKWRIYDAQLDRAGAWGGTERRNDGVVVIHISVAAMKDVKLLYHTIGHELVHAADYINGYYDHWSNIINNSQWKDSAEGVMRVIYEYHGYRWDAATEKAFGTNYGAANELEYYTEQMRDLQLMDLVHE